MRSSLEGTGRTDEQLAREAAREDSDGPAFQALVQRYRDQVWQICFRLMGNAEDASDAAQEVFVRLFLHRGRYQQKSKYSTWMYGVALRTCLSMRRARSRRVRRVQAAEITPEMVGQPGEANTTSLRIDLQQMLNTLNEEDRALLILKYAQGHSYDQLAEMFGLSVSACKMRVSRAREKLQQRFPEIKND
ncbi:MAG: sigma-70 family RNA polymerase sigma factor [Planctomycetales bacterium]|nr:sigma-70 family RNA polymerase sigma factor [Planctomycetales bacterium]